MTALADAICGAKAHVRIANAEANLTRPARVWTENAIYQAYYARMLLTDYLPDAIVDSDTLKAELLAAGEEALAAVDRYEAFLREELLPRSDRSPQIIPHSDRSLLKVVKSDPALTRFTLGRVRRVSRGFYISQAMELAALTPKLQAIAKARGGADQPVFVRGDKTVAYGTVARVMAQIREAGFRKLSLVTQIETGG